MWIGGAIGQALAFLLARYLLRDWVENFIRSKWKKWKYIDAAIENEGWKLVLIMRLSPVIPYNLLNIAMATTSMHFVPFTIVSAIGIVFECAVFVYLGTMAESITSIASGDAGPPKAIQWVLLGVSITMCILGAVFVSIMVKRAIKKAEEATSDSALDLASMAEEAEEQEALLATPSTLPQEGYIKSIPGLNKLTEARNAIFKLQNATFLPVAERRPVAPGTLTPHLRNNSTKAKMSPRAESGVGNTPFKSPESQRDVELGSASLPKSGNRRAPFRRSQSRLNDSDDESESNGR